MIKLTAEAKEAIVKKALARGDKSIRQVADESNVGYSSLQKWLRCKREGRPLNATDVTSTAVTNQHTPPLEHLLATAGLDEQAIGAYCREQGIYSFQLEKWKNELMKSNNSTQRPDKGRGEIKALRDEVKRLKQDLRRKDAALAETSALLVLKKKADLIWGDLEDD